MGGPYLRKVYFHSMGIFSHNNVLVYYRIFCLGHVSYRQGRQPIATIVQAPKSYFCTSSSKKWHILKIVSLIHCLLKLRHKHNSTLHKRGGHIIII